MTIFCMLYILNSVRLKIQQSLILQEGLSRRNGVDVTRVELSGAARMWQLMRSAPSVRWALISGMLALPEPGFWPQHCVIPVNQAMLLTSLHDRKEHVSDSRVHFVGLEFLITVK